MAESLLKRVERVFLETPTSLFSAQNIADRTGGNKKTIGVLLSQLHAYGIISRKGRGIYTLAQGDNRVGSDSDTSDVVRAVQTLVDKYKGLEEKLHKMAEENAVLREQLRTARSEVWDSIMEQLLEFRPDDESSGQESDNEEPAYRVEPEVTPHPFKLSTRQKKRKSVALKRLPKELTVTKVVKTLEAVGLKVKKGKSHLNVMSGNGSSGFRLTFPENNWETNTNVLLQKISKSCGQEVKWNFVFLYHQTKKGRKGK